MLKIGEDQDAVTVDTGKVKFSVNKHKFGLIDALWLDGEQILTPGKPGGFYLTGPDGTVYTSLAAPDEVVVEESGPVRAVVRISGKHQSSDGRKLFTYTVRMHAWAGQPYIRLQHTFGNDNGATDFTDLKSLVMKLPFAAEESSGRWPAAPVPFEGKTPFALFNTPTIGSPSSQDRSCRANARRVGPSGPAEPTR